MTPKQIVQNIVDNFLKIQFAHGRREDAAAFDANGNKFVWLYPVTENYELTKANAIEQAYDLLIDFGIPGDTKPGEDEEQAFIDAVRPDVFKFLVNLSRHEDIKSVGSGKGVPFYPWRDEPYYGIQLTVTITLRMPATIC